MRFENRHPSDQQLLLSLEGELAQRDVDSIGAHLAACWTCRARRREIENAIAEFTHVYQKGQLEIPAANGPRALLKARLAQLSDAPMRRFHPAGAFVVTVVAATVLLLTYSFAVRRDRPTFSPVFSIPNAALTPGAAVLTSRQAVCSQANIKNKVVSATVRERVFAEYGISRAEPRAYEVDYLVTPALGGADDVRNLWPHSYSATVWNAQVKDALEDRLRAMVCSGSLDLRVAQAEIATNWIAAYKKYFHTERPLEQSGGE